MSDKTPIEKLRILLPHWIEHNHSHEAEFKKWAKLIRNEKSMAAVAALLDKAIISMEETDKILAEALSKIGGPSLEHHHHHHGHGHD